LKQMLRILCAVMTSIVNLSLSAGTFANILKSAIVRPLLKKQGLELITKIADL